MKEFCAFGATALLCLTWLICPAEAQTAGAPARDPFMVLGLAAPPPSGHRAFCRDNPEECRSPAPGTRAQAPRPVELSTPLVLSIAAINTAVNARIRPISDKLLYGVEERWAYPTDAGDCEDFVLLKRRLLNEIDGIALGNLLITVVRRKDGEGHAVLTLRATSGDFVLDNLDWRIKDFADTPYRYLKRQDPVDPAAWWHVEDGKELVVGAVKK